MLPFDPLPMKSPLLVASLLLTVAAAAAEVTETYESGPLDLLIADGSAVLTPSLLSITGSAIVTLSKIEVSFELIGAPAGTGFAQDMFVSLLRSEPGGPITVTDASAILLDRVASAHDGWWVTLGDFAAQPIQTATPALVTGVLLGAFRPAESLADAFGGLAATGDWRLNVGDLAAGGTMKLLNWSLTLTGESDATDIPEPGTWAAGAVALLTLVGQRFRRRR
jgi:hypothetical protein